MSAERLNVLVSSAGRRVELVDSFRTALLELGLKGSVYSADCSALSASLYVGDSGFIVPTCDDSSFIPTLLSLCKRQNIGLIIPTIDTELPILAAERDSFEDNGVRVAISGPATVAVGADKQLSHSFLAGVGVPTVRQESLRDAQQEPGKWRFPIVAKPRFGSGSRGVRAVESVDDLLCLDPTEEFIVQDKAPGTEYTVDVLLSRLGELVCAVPRRRLEVRGGEVSKAVTVAHAGILECVEMIVAALEDGYGPITIQVFVDGDSDVINAIEMNPRFGGGFPLSWEAGARYSRWLIEELLGLPSTASADGWRENLVMLRWDAGVFVDQGALAHG